MTTFSGWFRAALFSLLAVVLASCAAPDPNAPLPATKPIGDFKLGILAVSAEGVQKGPMSRDATPEELQAALETELRRRFGSLTGSKFYNMSVTINAYALARVGVPLLFTPSSAMITTVNFWDDAKQKIILDEDKRFTVLEKLTGKSFVGSGLTMTREEQLHEIVMRTADRIEAYMREHEDAFRATAEEKAAAKADVQ